MHRRRRADLLLVAAVTTLMAGAGTARAGGGTWVFENQGLNREAIFTPGDPVQASSGLALRAVESGKRAVYWAGPEHGPFFGYLSRRVGPDRRPQTPPLPKDAILVGEVRFSETKQPGVLHVSLEFVMPDLEPGYYTLHHCNDPCTRQIGDTMSTPITVVEDRGQALLAARVQRLEVRDVGFRFRVEDRIDDLKSENAGLESDIAALQNKMNELADRPVAAPLQREPSIWTAVGWGVAGAVLALLVVLAFGNIRPKLRRRALPHLH